MYYTVYMTNPLSGKPVFSGRTSKKAVVSNTGLSVLAVNIQEE